MRFKSWLRYFSIIHYCRVYILLYLVAELVALLIVAVVGLLIERVLVHHGAVPMVERVRLLPATVHLYYIKTFRLFSYYAQEVLSNFHNTSPGSISSSLFPPFFPFTFIFHFFQLLFTLSPSHES